MYGVSYRKVSRPDDDQFYCVAIIPGQALGETIPGKGSFEDMCAQAHRVLAERPDVVRVHVDHKGNFWKRITR